MTERFGRYVLTERIAAGGMAEIFRGAAVSMEGFSRPLAIKRVLPESAMDPEFMKMLVDEAKIASTLHHPNVVQVTDLGQIDGQYFIAMEYIEGRHLGVVIGTAIRKQLPMPLPFALYVARDALYGLGHAHAKTMADGKPLGIVHRDISPQNLMVGFDGSVRVADFGIAKAMGRASQTDDGVVKGKYSYMSPEQARGERVDSRTDIYAMGVVLWEVLAAQRLYPSKIDRAEVTRMVIAGEHRPLASVAPHVPTALTTVVDRALSVRREDRYATCEEFAADVSAQLGALAPGYATPNAAAEMRKLFGAEVDDERRKVAELESLARRLTTNNMPVVTPEPITPESKTVAAPPVTKPVRRGQSVAQAASTRAGVAAGALLLVCGVAASVLVLRGAPAASSTTWPPVQNASRPSLTRVTVETSPSGAVLAINGVAQGRTPMTVSLPVGVRALLLVEKNGSQPTTREITPAGAEQNVLIALERATSAPRPLKKAPADDVKVDSAARPVTLAPVAEVAVPLPALVEQHKVEPTLMMESLPAGASIWVKDEFRGFTPKAIVLTGPAPIAVRIELAGYQSETWMLRTLPKAPIQRMVNLRSKTQAPSTPAPAKEAAAAPVADDAVLVSVSFFTDIPARVTLDGRLLGDETPIVDMLVAVGKHKVTLTPIEGGRTETTEFVAVEGERHVVNKTLAQKR